jgi:hypothetical protein
VRANRGGKSGCSVGQCQVIWWMIWFHARSRRSCPLHRRVVDDTAAAAVPCPPSARTGPDARRAPAVQHVSRWTYHLDVPGVRRRGLWACADRRLPDSRRCRSGALKESGRAVGLRRAEELGVTRVSQLMHFTRGHPWALMNKTCWSRTNTEQPWLRMGRLQRTHNPLVAGSSPARPT